MSFLNSILKKISPFHNTTDLVLFPKNVKPYLIDPYVIPYQLEFDGVTNWVRTLNLFTSPHFHFSSKKEYNYFKSTVENLKTLKFENIEVTEIMTSEEILKTLNDLQTHHVKIVMLIHQKGVTNLSQIPQLQVPIKNLVILNYEDFYQKIGMTNVKELVYPLVQSGSACGIQVSVIGDQKNISPNVLSSIVNKVESSGSWHYLNSEVFDNISKKYENVLNYLSQVPSFVSGSKLVFEDDSQYKNQGLVESGVFVFYDDRKYKEPETKEERNTEFALKMRHGAYGKCRYVYVLSKTEDFLIVEDIYSHQIGMIDSEKLSQVSRARVG